MKNKGDLSVVILRPSIIASTLKDPFPGWTDSLSAAGGLTVMTGIGLINFVNSEGINHFDIIPVDIVTNSILVVTANGAMQPEQLEVYNCGTSRINPLTVGNFKDYMLD